MNVTIFSKPGCQACNATKRTLDRLNLPYTEIDIMSDHRAAQRLREMGSLELPRVEVKVTGALSGVDWQDSWTGFRPTKIEELYAKYEIGA